MIDLLTLHLMLRQKRKARNLTQAQAAERIGVCLRTYAAWERGGQPRGLSIQAIEQWLQSN